MYLEFAFCHYLLFLVNTYSIATTFSLPKFYVQDLSISLGAGT